jgi:uncharacterized protein
VVGRNVVPVTQRKQAPLLVFGQLSPGFGNPTAATRVEIDYCPDCRGVWLDRGELDKIIDRSLGQPAPQQQYAAPPAAPQRPAPYSPQPQQGYYKKKRKESWLSELFD